MDYMIRAASLTNYVGVARSVGLDPYEMLAAVGLDRGVLLDPDTRIPGEAVRQLLENSARLSGAEDFGLRLAENRHLSNLGPLGLVVKEEPTLRAMLQTMVRYMRLHNEALFLQIEEAGDVVLIRQELTMGRPTAVRQSVELAIGVTFRVLQLLLGPQWRPLRVCFAHRAPANRSRHLALFGPAVAFGAEFNGIVCRARDLDAPIRDADPALALYARRYLDSLMARPHAGVEDRVRELVFLLLPAGRCSIERVAQHLGVDRRTVHRHLAQRGTTFSAVVGDVRAELAQRHLGTLDRGLADVSELLGFSASSAFSRWFRARFGCTASQWRARSALAAEGTERTKGAERTQAPDAPDATPTAQTVAIAPRLSTRPTPRPSSTALPAASPPVRAAAPARRRTPEAARRPPARRG
jgi:AraC-like DNA-binding protein